VDDLAARRTLHYKHPYQIKVLEWYQLRWQFK